MEIQKLNKVVQKRKTQKGKRGEKREVMKSEEKYSKGEKV